MIGVQRAGPRSRHHAALIIAGLTLGGAALILLFEHFRHDFLGWITDDPARISRRSGIVLLLVALLGSGPLLGFALYFWRLGARILREERYPPSGVRVFRDAAVVRGGPAVRRGRGVRVVAGLLLVAALLLPLLLWRIWFLVHSRVG